MTPLISRIFLLLIILFFSFKNLLYTQNKVELRVEENPYKWLNSDLSGKSAMILHVQGELKFYDIDTVTNMLYAVSTNDGDALPAGKGLLSAFDLTENKTLWVREFMHARDVFMLIDTIPMLIGEGTNAFAPKTGLLVWSSKFQVLPVWNKDGIIFGSDIQGAILCGLNLRTGSIIWQKKNRSWIGTETILPVGDTGIAILRDNFRYISLKTGEEFKEERSDRLFFNPHFHEGFGFMGALLAEKVTQNLENKTEVFNENSLTNAAFRAGEIYLATDKEIIAFTSTGEIRWEYKLSRKLVGVCRLFFYNNHLYAVNYGRILTASFPIQGYVFIGCFDPGTGLKKYSSNLTGGRRMNINHMTIKDSMMIVNTNRGMMELALRDLRIIKNLETKQNPGLGMIEVLQPPHFILKENRLENRSMTHPDLIIVKNNNDVKIEMTESFQPLNVIPKNEYYKLLGNWGEQMVLSNDREIVIANNDLDIYPIRFSRNARRHAGIISDHNESSILLLPENEIIGE